jgi:hypothetical protein
MSKPLTPAIVKVFRLWALHTGLWIQLDSARYQYVDTLGRTMPPVKTLDRND